MSKGTIPKRNRKRQIVVFTSTRPSKELLRYVKNLKKQDAIDVVFVGVKPSVSEKDFDGFENVVLLDETNEDDIAGDVSNTLATGLCVIY